MTNPNKDALHNALAEIFCKEIQRLHHDKLSLQEVRDLGYNLAARYTPTITKGGCATCRVTEMLREEYGDETESIIARMKESIRKGS